MNRYEQGNMARISGLFTDPLNDDAPQDPTNVYCHVFMQDGTKLEYQYGVDPEIVKSAVGSYYVDLSLSVPGRVYYRWWSTGTGQASDYSELLVTAARAT